MEGNMEVEEQSTMAKEKIVVINQILGKREEVSKRDFAKKWRN